MIRMLTLGIGGFLGAVGRYWLSGIVYRLLGSNFPYGTLFVNVLGCFLLGLSASLTEERFLVGPTMRAFLNIGLLGAFTTFSTFSYETVELLRIGNHLPAMANVAVSLLTGLAAVYIGMVVARLL